MQEMYLFFDDNFYLYDQTYGQAQILTEYLVDQSINILNKKILKYQAK